MRVTAVAARRRAQRATSVVTPPVPDRARVWQLEPALVPFVVIALVGQVVAALTPGALVRSELVVSTALLVVVVGLVGWREVRRHWWGPALPITCYVASVAILVLSEGATTSGSGQLLLLPLLGAALLSSYQQSVVASVAVLAGLLAISVQSNADVGTTVRKLILWAAICVLVAVPIHALRRRLVRSAAADERRRIARDLHDGLAQELAYIAARARAIARVVDDDDAQSLTRSADRALDEARRAITVLSSDDHEPLAVSMARTAEDLAQRYGLTIRVELPDTLEVVPDRAEQLLRIAREAITNAARHADPSSITVRVWHDDLVHLVVEDDGRGFDPSASARGFGLVSMRERAEAMGGSLELHSEVGRGTHVEVRVP